jgi:hypothetical protein
MDKKNRLIAKVIVVVVSITMVSTMVIWAMQTWV